MNRPLLLPVALILLLSASPSRGVIYYRAQGGGPAGDATTAETVPPATLNGGAACPPLSTPNFLCAQFLSST